MLNSKAIIALSISLFSQFAFAGEQALITVGNDETKKTYQLVVESIDARTIKAFYKDVFENGKKITREKLEYKTLANAGMILEQREKHIVLRLKSNNFDEQLGGIITLDTLYNGANGTRKGYDVQLAKVNTGWAIFSAGKVIKTMFIQTNKIMIIGAVGIKNIVMK